MKEENTEVYVRQLREKSKMPLRKLSALLDLDQNMLSKLERGERPINRQMLPIIAKTFNVNEKQLVVKFMSRQVASQLANEPYAKDILLEVGKKIRFLVKQ